MCLHAHFGKAKCSTSDLEQVHILLEAARKDASALRGMGDPALFPDEAFGFHTQQAAGKLCKVPQPRQDDCRA